MSNMKHRNAKKGSVSNLRLGDYNIGNLETLAAAELPHISDFFTERDIARICVVSLATVRRWRLQGVGPRFHKFQSAVRYAPADVLDWIRTRPTGGTQAA
jgi:hypothetical protein